MKRSLPFALKQKSLTKETLRKYEPLNDHRKTMNPKKQEFAHKKQTSDKIQKDTQVNNLAQVVITEIRRFARFGTIFKILKT